MASSIPTHETLYQETNARIAEITTALNVHNNHLLQANQDITVLNESIVNLTNDKTLAELQTEKNRLTGIFELANTDLKEVPGAIEKTKHVIALLQKETLKEKAIQDTPFLNSKYQETLAETFQNALDKLLATGTLNNTLSNEVEETVKKSTHSFNCIVEDLKLAGRKIERAYASVKENAKHLQTKLDNLERMHKSVIEAIKAPTTALTLFCQRVENGGKDSPTIIGKSLNYIASYIPNIRTTPTPAVISIPMTTFEPSKEEQTVELDLSNLTTTDTDTVELLLNDQTHSG